MIQENNEQGSSGSDWHEAPNVDTSSQQSEVETRGSAQGVLALKQDDIATWKRGAESFRRFMASLQIEKSTHEDFESIQSMFLGERATTFGDTTALALAEHLEPFGFQCIGYYVFRSEVVTRIVQEHSQEFSGLPTQPEFLMHALHVAGMEKYHIPRGLLLGYPLSVCKEHVDALNLRINAVANELLNILGKGNADYDYLVESFFSNREDPDKILRFFEEKMGMHYQRLGISKQDIPALLKELQYLLNSRGAEGVHGQGWIEYSTSEEGELRKARIRAAFEQSGILLEN
jgi:hypothetical protein